jgi:hypothetical protein
MAYWGQLVTVTERATDGMIVDWKVMRLNDSKCALTCWKCKRVTYRKTDILFYKAVPKLQKFIIVVCFLLGNSPAYIPAFSIPTRLWRCRRQNVPKRRHIKFRRRGITQKKAYSIQNTAKVWNKEKLIIAWNAEWRNNCLIERLSKIGWFKNLIIKHKID